MAVLGLVVLLAASSLGAMQAEARGHGHWGGGSDGDCGCDEPAALVCEAGQHVASVMTDPGQEAVEEVSHIVYHDPVTEDQQVCVEAEHGAYKNSSCSQEANKYYHGKRYDLVTQTVVVQEGYEEVVIDVEGQEAIAPTYEDQCVDDQPAPVDVCTNIDGAQESVPEGYTAQEDGSCTEDQPDGGDTPAPQITHSAGGACINCGPTEVASDAAAAPEVPLVEEPVTTTDIGEVAGATCEPLLTTYMRESQQNPSDEVSKLQTFLNKELGTNIPVTGVFDHTTTAQVDMFQAKYWQDVLLPWVSHGLANEKTPTGYVYKTTLWKINKIACSALDLPKPELP
jgi:hypothetical protein